MAHGSSLRSLSGIVTDTLINAGRFRRREAPPPTGREALVFSLSGYFTTVFKGCSLGAFLHADPVVA